MLKKVLLGLAGMLVIGLIYFKVAFYPMLPIASGYAAKKMCSCHFISERTQESIQNEDLGFYPLYLTSTTIDEEEKSATTTLFGLAKRKAVYRDNLGCILLKGKDDYNVQLDLSPYSISEDELWPKGNADNLQLTTGIDPEQLKKAVINAFDKGAEKNKRTRAVVIIHRDTLVLEEYAPGFDKDTEILGWSMTKSITSTLFGILARQKRISLNTKMQFLEWKDDTRKDIRLRSLLNMASGLSFSENYGQISDVTNMLYNAEQVWKIPVNNKLIANPDSIWSYSSGTTNLLSKFLRNQFTTDQTYLEFPHKALFRKIGMATAHLETDESGIYIGSSYMYATPRDWARFGLLYLNEGNWFGDQIIDTIWVNFSKQIIPQSEGHYGGHFWHNGNHAVYPDVPADMFSANGFQGQNVFIFPSHDLVVVRMGLAQHPEFDVNQFLREIIEALK